MDQWPESPSNARKLYKCVSTQLYPLCLNVSYKWPMAQFHPNACKVYNTNWNALFYPCDATVRLTLLSRILLKTHKLHVYSITFHVCPDILTGKHAVVVDLLAAKQWSEHHTYSPPPPMKIQNSGPAFNDPESPVFIMRVIQLYLFRRARNKTW